MKRLLFLFIVFCILCTVEEYVHMTPMLYSYKHPASNVASTLVPEEKPLTEKNLQLQKKCDTNKQIKEDLKKIDDEKFLKFILLLTTLKKS
jgi:hypothetical protein